MSDGARMLTDAAGLAANAGIAIANREFANSGSLGGGEEKGDPNVGHHAIVTKEDVGAQTMILSVLANMYPGAFFLTEEKQENDPTDGRILCDENLELVKTEDVFVVDPLDGSSFRNRRHPGWSVSIGVMKQGKHIGGVIYAPLVCGRLLVSGSNGVGIDVGFLEEGGTTPDWARIGFRERKKSIVFVGLDTHFMKQFSPFVLEFSRQVQTVSSTTCALGLAYLCAGKIDAFVQPVQCPWDWAAGYPLVEGAGGKFQFYHYRCGRPEPMEKPDLPSYSPTQRNTAFIAGNPEIVDWLFKLLCQTWQA